jgi:nucleolin
MVTATDIIQKAKDLCSKHAKDWEALRAEVESSSKVASEPAGQKHNQVKPKAASPKPKPAADDSDSDDSDVPVAAAKPKPKPKPAPQDSDSDDSDVPAAKPKAQPKAAAKPKAPIEDSSSDGDVVPAAKPKPKPTAKPADDSDDDSDDAPPPKPAAPKEAPKRKAENGNGVAPAAKLQKLESSELVLYDIPDSMTDDDLWNHYKTLGEDAVVKMNRPASRQNMCFVTFQSPELAAQGLALDAPSKDGAWASVKVNHPKGKGKGKGGDGGESFDVMIRNCADGITDDVVYSHYKSIADSITVIKWVTDRDTGSFKGFGFIKFATKEAAEKAVELGGPTYEDRETTVRLAEGKGEKGGKGDKGGKGGKGGKGKGGRGPSMVPEGAKVTFDD